MELLNRKPIQVFAYLAIGILIMQGIVMSGSDNINGYAEILPSIDTSINIHPISQNNLPVSITFTDLPQVGVRDNQPELDLVGETLPTKDFIDSKPTSIPATYFAAMTLFNMGDPSFTAMIPSLVDYLMGHYNSTSHRFEEAINYAYYADNDGADLLHAPYSPEIIHYMALILLAHCGELQNLFSDTELFVFDVAIWNSQNADGGFGVLHSPNSTLLETYFSVYALAAMSDFVFGFLFPMEILILQQYIRACQSNDLFTGPFNEFDKGGNFGWSMFLATWLALNTIEIMHGDPSEYKADFVSFWQAYNLYNTESHCFYGSFNERSQPSIIYFYGTAIVGDCVRILGVEDEFPDLAQADIVLLNSTHYNQAGIVSGPNYFEITSTTLIDDLWIQFLVSHYLANRGKIDLLKDANENYQGLSAFIQSYFTGGGASPLSQWHTTAKFDHEYYSSQDVLSESPVNSEELFASIMEKRAESQDHFQAYSAYNLRYLEPAIEPFHNPVASSYHIISLMNQFDLLMDFYKEVGMDYLNYEGWFVSQLSPEGYFYDNNRWYSGTLQSTYMALAAQDILISFNQGQVIENYYSPENISSIVEFLSGFISESSEYWYITTDVEQLDRFQATLYVLQIFDILHHEFSDPRLEDWITMEIHQSDELSWVEFGHLCELADYLGMILPGTPSFSHNDVKSICDAIVVSDILLVAELQWLVTMIHLNTIQLFMDIPQGQIGNNPYAYSIQVVSFLTVESIENIQIQGERTQFSDWSWIGGQYEGIVIPELNDNPTVWSARLLFTWNDISFESQFTVSLEVPLDISWGYKTNELGTYVWYVLTIDEEIGIRLVPSIQILSSAEEIIESFSPQEIVIVQQGNKFNYSITLTESTYTNESFYEVGLDFNMSWLDVFLNQFQFIQWESPSPIPPNDTTTDTTEITPTDPPTDPPTNSTDPTTFSNDSSPPSSKFNLDLGITSALFGSTGLSGVLLIWFRKDSIILHDKMDKTSLWTISPY